MSTQNKKAHFIGICGAGMSAVAKLLADSGWEVSGSDENFYPPVSDYIKKQDIKIKKGYNPKNIPDNVGLIIIGKHAGLTKESNEEVWTAFSLRVPVKSFPEVLSDLSDGKTNIVVAGSYGKSTCSALAAWCLECAGKNPSYFIGAIPNTPADSSRMGESNLFILEGDEYPSSNWDDSSKFLHYHPEHILLTSLAHDHLNVFKTPEDYKKPFIKLLSLLPRDGLVAACADGEGIKETLSASNFKKSAVFYSVKSNAPWHISNLKFGEETSFDIFHEDKFIVNIRMSLLGMHNVENILGVGALLFSLKLVTPSQFSKAIASFRAINRRLDKKSYKTSVPVYEGFGSSYAKARSAIEAVKLHFPGKKLFVLFEPHSFSWRNQGALAWYDTVFKDAYRTFIYKTPVNDEKELSLGEIVDRIKKSGHSAEGFDNLQKGIELLENNIDGNSVVLALSSGGFDGFIGLATEWLERKFPQQSSR